MKTTPEAKFLEALDICQSLRNFKYYPTNLTYQAIELFCEIGENPPELLALCQKYSSQVEKTCKVLNEYATSLDNVRVDCPLGFGAKDHCSFLSFFLNLDSRNFEYFTGNFTTAEQIAELFKDCRGIDLIPFLKQEVNLTP